ncbi:MAG: helix-turn-helix domain-containing protein [Pseudonocardiaceae bacterium]
MAREPVHVVELRCALGGVLGVCRQRVGWSQAKLADRVHYHRSAISHLEAGRHPAPRDFWERADTLLGAEGALVAGHDDLAAAKRECERSVSSRHPEVDDLAGELGHDLVLSAPWTAAGTVESAVVLKGGDGRVKRRVFISLTGAALTAPAHQWLIHEPGPLVSGLSGRRVSIGLVDRFTAMIAELRRMDDVAGGGGVLSLAEHQFGWVAGLLGQASYDERTGRALHIVLAELGQLCGWSAYDAGHHGLAQRYWLAGLRAAHSADDRPFGAHILATMANQAARQGQPAEAVTFIDTALAGTRGQATPALLAELHFRQAYAYAAVCDTSGCTAAISKARTQVEQLKPDEDPPWLYWLDPAAIAVGAGNCFLLLGRPDQAAALLDKGIAQFDESFIRDRQIYLTRLADARARLGKQQDLDAAAGLGMESIDLAENLDSNTGAGCLRDLYGQMKQHHKVPAVRDFLDRARGLVQV